MPLYLKRPSTPGQAFELAHLVEGRGQKAVDTVAVQVRDLEGATTKSCCCGVLLQHHTALRHTHHNTAEHSQLKQGFIPLRNPQLLKQNFMILLPGTKRLKQVQQCLMGCSPRGRWGQH